MFNKIYLKFIDCLAVKKFTKRKILKNKLVCLPLNSYIKEL